MKLSADEGYEVEVCLVREWLETFDPQNPLISPEFQVVDGIFPVKNGRVIVPLKNENDFTVDVPTATKIAFCKP